MNFNTCNKVNLFIVRPFTFAHKAATTIVFLTKLQAKKTNQTVCSVLITTCTYDTAKTKQKPLTGNLTQCTLYTVFTVYHSQEYLTMVRNPLWVFAQSTLHRLIILNFHITPMKIERW